MKPARPALRNPARLRRLIGRALSTFGLNLRRLTVLTEAATGPYALTPVIAALAGAERVLTLARGSRWGTAAQADQEVMDLAARWGVATCIHSSKGREDPRLAEADVVTNLGAVRPLDEELLTRLKPTAAIALMWEPWEFRPEDLDLGAARRLGLAVLGTNEHHVHLGTFGYVGTAALKLMLEADLEVRGTRVVVAGGPEFGEPVRDAVRQAGGEATLVAPGALPQVGSLLAEADALVVAHHPHREAILGPGALLEAKALAAWNPGITVVHLSGGVDQGALEAAGLAHVPEFLAPAGYMSVATDHVGPRPLIDLHTAGLRVGADLARARLAGLERAFAERHVLQTCPYSLGFLEEVGTPCA
jgi:hypothetical protein